MAVAEILKETQSKMEKSLAALRTELAGLRAGRATPALLDRLRVDYYGNPTPVNQLATINAPDPRTLVIQPWDKNAVGAIEKAIQKSDLGMHPNTEGGVIRLNLPQLTAERRAELMRHVRRLAEDQKVAVRNLRREAREHIERDEKSGATPGDQAHRAMEELQRVTDRAVEQISHLCDLKEKEIAEV